jgi:hypothetical protein
MLGTVLRKPEDLWSETLYDLDEEMKRNRAARARRDEHSSV